MTRRRPHLRVLRAAALAITASAVGVVHAASLGGISAAPIDAWNLPLDIETGDVTPPTITATVSPAPNAFGWNNTSVTVTFTCNDTESGIASCTDPITVTTEGAGQVVVGTAVDNAGNSASTSVSLDVDMTGPVVDIVGFGDGDILQTAPTVTCTATDALSGVVGGCTVTTTPGPAAGQFVVTATADDYAGNVTVVVEEYWVLAICGIGPSNLPCVVPFGQTVNGGLTWNADVLVLGEITGALQVLDGNITVGATGVVGGNIGQSGVGGVTVIAGGVASGEINETGDGALIVGGSVAGNVFEADTGDLTVSTDATVGGAVVERGSGSVTVDGFVTGPVEEYDVGDLTVGAGATLSSGAAEVDDGSLAVFGTVNGNATEKHAGHLTVHAGASIVGDAEEANDGNLTVFGPSSITGTATEGGAGDLTIGASVVVGANAHEASNGVCTISPLATIQGNRTGGCAV